ncbi:MAG: carboxylating nicotinate-nucleotide diphosphorylase [Streptococcaceae bacterium]|jgi:nicotinate-nucleotide pyrophosphorylase (carboxylating)|nr:carboxylating nicotinate-nucleotide diphosphorylase [Streptococcaceae bacterium]
MNLLMKTKIKEFLLEDIGSGDVSAESIFSKDELSKGYFIAKSEGIFAGENIPQFAYEAFGENIHIQLNFHDGDWVKPGDVLLEVEGSVLALLSCERVILNLMQRMSGIATMTHNAIEKLNDPKMDVVDTRKTAPGLRVFDKKAVSVGGGKNHRFGLYDAVMLKDNHIAFSGGISKAVQSVRKRVGHMTPIEVEIETLSELKEAILARPNVIMFDNLPPERVKEFSKLVPETICIEVSGGITLENIGDFRECGGNVISLGWLTHSVQSFDISFNKELKENKGKC